MKTNSIPVIEMLIGWFLLSICVNASALELAIAPELQKQLKLSYEERGFGYIPRTEHINDDGTPRYINRLIQEDSPYLLQHAHNPVNWYPWGKEAFDQATELDLPVFLSIGYATCHWCHVMEAESFESENIAAQMNKQFISIKVDREQLPDIDALYMLGVQLMTGRGGWPLSGFLQHDGKMFHGATYMRPDQFSSVMHQVSDQWTKSRDRITEIADGIDEAIRENSRLSSKVKNVGQAEIQLARDTLLLNHDYFQGGFGSAPKFPRESSLLFLLDMAMRNDDAKALSAVDFSLIRMSAGGIHDQVGGGFHRYAVDDDWLVPHFEKMLYNQASLLQVYLHAFELTGKTEHARTARRIADYVLRDMTAANGGFYSATDADSEGREGTYFIWSKQDVKNILTKTFGSEDADLAIGIWGITEEGNFEESNILRLDDSLESIANQKNLTMPVLLEKLDKYSATLLEQRNSRIPPLTDDKIITEWNAMMITALIKAGHSLNERRYSDAAMRALDFVMTNNLKQDGTLWRAQFEGKSSTSASQSDYAYLAHALLSAFDITGENSWFGQAIALVDEMNERFWDSENKGYFIGHAEVAGAILPTRPKAIYDNATPSGNALALKVLVQLWHRTGDAKYKQRAESLVSAFSRFLSRDGSAFSYFLVGANDLINGEFGPVQYTARGKVKVAVLATDEKTIAVSIEVASGWHINSDKPLQDYLIPTKLKLSNGASFKQVDYPSPINRSLGFQRSELSLLEDNVEITALLPDDAQEPHFVNVELQIQACSDEVCLAPENLKFKVPFAIHR